ncbi:MAG: hypothetical protein KAJ18_05865 [Candidatus Omnitrophica bacterium]|nr:hypothetical protein [Candidatus Omnitrophota bacterium]
MREIFKKLFFRIEGFFLQFKGKKDVLFVARNELMFDYTYIIYKHMLSDRRVRVWFCLPTPENFINYKKAIRRFAPRRGGFN